MRALFKDRATAVAVKGSASNFQVTVGTGEGGAALENQTSARYPASS